MNLKNTLRKQGSSTMHGSVQLIGRKKMRILSVYKRRIGLYLQNLVSSLT